MTILKISAGPGTDIWRKPPHTDVFNAPSTPPSSGRLSSFVSAQASFSFAWSEQYDQAGLLLTFHAADDNDNSAPPPKWIKTGIEFYNGRPMLSTVSCDRWADWSVTPLPESAADETWTTIAIERAGDEHGASLWVYLVLEGEGGAKKKVPLREICWVYGDRDPAAAWRLEVSAMAARPEKKASTALDVQVRDLEVKWD